MVYSTDKTNIKGNIALGKAISYFISIGCIVSIPLNDSQCYDLIVESNGDLETVQVKFTSELSRNHYIVPLRTVSGTSKLPIYTLKDSFVDYLFVLSNEYDARLIPVKKIDLTNCMSLYKDSKHIKQQSSLETSDYYLGKI